MDINNKCKRILENANCVASQTPMGEDDAWDDTEAWVIEAAELAHDVLAIIRHFQDGGEVPPSWRNKQKTRASS